MGKSDRSALSILYPYKGDRVMPAGTMNRSANGSSRRTAFPEIGSEESRPDSCHRPDNAGDIMIPKHKGRKPPCSPARARMLRSGANWPRFATKTHMRLCDNVSTDAACCVCGATITGTMACSTPDTLQLRWRKRR
ncbi:hypothetical protein AURDEDRAFT_136845 [Auricularia subglabra TFB-10046 SS5]|nr:hypothetical protein AURDEDRAFT_136845 [Auricularia subglabra TFB-10046 SS5]